MSRASVLVVRNAVPEDQNSGASPVALSMHSCRHCRGRGLVACKGRYRTCACVYRRVFRACLDSYHYCQASMGSPGAVQCERVGRAQGRCAIVASFKRAEYAADFILLARRVLAFRPIEMAVFNAFHVDDLEWIVAVPRVNRLLRQLRPPRRPRPLNRGSFFHAVYRAEGLIGAAILTTRPYSLFPPRQYFAGFSLSATSLSASRVRSR